MAMRFGARQRDTGDAFPADVPYPAGVEQPWPENAGPPTPPSRGLPAGLSHPHPDFTERILELLGGLEHGRQALLDQLWAEIPSWIFESAYNPTQGANVPLVVGPQTTTLEVITCVIASLPAAGLLQLGSNQLPLPAGVTVLDGATLVLNSSAVRTLTPSALGPTALWLSGHQAPTAGVLAP